VTHEILQTVRPAMRVANHNQIILGQPLLGINPNHNQTVVRRPGLSYNHNQTLIRR